MTGKGRAWPAGDSPASPVLVFDAPLIRGAVDVADLIDPMTRAFSDFSAGVGESHIMVFAPAGPEGDVHVKSAWLQGRSVFTVKVATWFAARATQGRSPSSGFVAVNDAATGDLLAVLQDEHHLTDVRTAAAGAVSIQLMAREDARTLAVLGTGVQAYLQALAATLVRPIDTVLIWGRRPSAAHKLRAALLARQPRLQVVVAPSAEDAARQADIIVTATGSRQAILLGSWLQPGQHITAVGADDPAKAELDPECFRRADVVAVDSREHTPRFAGDLARALAADAVTAAQAQTEIGDLILGRHPGRQTDTQLTVAKLIGLGIQDLAAAEVALRKLTQAAPPAVAPAASSDSAAAIPAEIDAAS